MGEPEKINDFLRGIREAARHRLLNDSLGKCAFLRATENHCERGKHYEVTDRGEDEFPDERELRACPVAEAKEAERRQRKILESAPHIRKIAARYGVVKWAVDRSMWSQLLGAMNPRKPVRYSIGFSGTWQPLSSLFGIVRAGCEKPDCDGPNVMFTGSCGTGKTTLQAVRFLAAAESGIDAAFVDSIDIRKLVGDLNSKFSETAQRADRDFERLLRRAVIFWSDVGDTQATRREFAETVSSMLERFIGRLDISSNQSPPELESHPDIGQRAVSRMLAGRNGKPAVLVRLDGPDQRSDGIDLVQEVTAL